MAVELEFNITGDYSLLNSITELLKKIDESTIKLNTSLSIVNTNLTSMGRLIEKSFGEDNINKFVTGIKSVNDSTKDIGNKFSEWATAFTTLSLKVSTTQRNMGKLAVNSEKAAEGFEKFSKNLSDKAYPDMESLVKESSNIVKMLTIAAKATMAMLQEAELLNKTIKKAKRTNIEINEKLERQLKLNKMIKEQLLMSFYHFKLMSPLTNKIGRYMQVWYSNIRKFINKLSGVKTVLLYVKDAFENIIHVIKAIVSLLKMVTGVLKSIYAIANKILSIMKKMALTYFRIINGFIKGIFTVIGKIYSLLRLTVNFLIQSVLKLASIVVNTLYRAIVGIYNIVKSITNLIIKIIHLVGVVLYKAILAVYKITTSLVKLIATTLVLLINAIITTIKVFYNVFLATMKITYNVTKSILSITGKIIATVIKLPRIFADAYRELYIISKNIYSFITLPSRFFTYISDSIGRITKDAQNVFFRIYTSAWMIKRAFGETLKELIEFTKYIRSIELLRFIPDMWKSQKENEAQFKASANMIKKYIEDIAISTGTDLNDIAKAMYWAISSGFTQLKDALDITKQLAYMAQVSLAPVADVMTALTAAMNAYGLSAQSVNDILTAQFELVKRGVLVYSDISTSMGKVYASAKNIGVGYKELYTLVGFLSKMGLSVDRSTTALNTLFSKLADKTTINNFQKIGIQMFDINGKFRNFSDILEDLNTLTAGLNENVRSSILSALHIPLRLQKAFLTLIQNYKSYLAYKKQYNDDLKHSEALSPENMFKQSTNALQNFAYAMNRLESSWTVFTYSLQDILKSNDLVKFINKLTVGLKFLTSWVEKNSAAIQEWIIYLTKITTLIMGVWLSFKVIGVMLNPFVGIVFSLIIATAKLKKEFSELIDELFRALRGKGTFEKFGNDLMKFLPKMWKVGLNTFVDFIQRSIMVAKTGLMLLYTTLFGMFTKDKNTKNNINKLNSKYTSKLFLSTMLGVNLDDINSAYIEYQTKILGVINKRTKLANHGNVTIFDGLFDNIKQHIPIEFRQITEIIINQIDTLYIKVKNKFMSIFNNLFAPINTTAINTASANPMLSMSLNISKLSNNILNPLQEKLYSEVLNLFTINSTKKNAKMESKFTMFINNIFSNLKALLDKMTLTPISIVKDFAASLLDTIVGTFDLLINKPHKFKNSKNKANALWLEKIINNIINSIASLIPTIVNKIKNNDKVKNMWNDIIDAFMKLSWTVKTKHIKLGHLNIAYPVLTFKYLPNIDPIIKTINSIIDFTNNYITKLKNSQEVKKLTKSLYELIFGKTDKKDITFKDFQTKFIENYKKWLSDNGGLIPGIINATKKAFKQTLIGKKFAGVFNTLIESIEENLLESRFGYQFPNLSKEQLLKLFKQNGKLKDNSDVFLSTILAYLGLGTFKKPRGVILSQKIGSMTATFISVMEDSIKAFANLLTEFSSGKSNFTSLALAGAKLYGSIFDAITQSTFGINLQTGKYLGKLTKDLAGLGYEFSKIYEEQLKKPISKGSKLTFGEILSSDKYGLIDKVTALIKVIKLTITEDLTNDKSFLNKLTNTGRNIVDSLMKGFIDGLKKHWKLLAFLGAISTGNLGVVLTLGTVIGLSYMTEKFNEGPAGKFFSSMVSSSTKYISKSLAKLQSKYNKNLAAWLPGLEKNKDFMHNFMIMYPNFLWNVQFKDQKDAIAYLNKFKSINSNENRALYSLIMSALKLAGIRGFASGGFTPPVGKSVPVGVVHGGEWVAPKWMVDNPKYRSIIQGLELLRKGYKEGGIVSERIPYVSIGSPLAKSILDLKISTLIIQPKKLLNKLTPDLILLNVLNKDINKKLTHIVDYVKSIFKKIPNGDKIVNKVPESTAVEINKLINDALKKTRELTNFMLVLDSSNPVNNLLQNLADKVSSKSKLNEQQKEEYKTYIAMLGIMSSLKDSYTDLYNAVLKDVTTANDLYKAMKDTSLSAKDLLVRLLGLNTALEASKSGELGAMYGIRKLKIMYDDGSKTLKDLLNTTINPMYRQYAYSNVGDISDTMLASKILSGSNNPIVSSKMITDMQSLNLADKFAKHIGTTLEDYAKKNNLTMQDTIQEFAAAEQKYENAVKNSMINIGNTLLNGINNMTSKLVKSGLLSAKQGELINKTTKTLNDVGSALSAGASLGANLASQNYIGAIISGIDLFIDSINVVLDIVSMFQHNTTAVKDNTKAIMDLTDVQRRIQQSTYNGNTNLVIRITNLSGETLLEYNTSSGINAYDILID